MGRRNRPFYRLIAIDSKKRREGREIERLGWYNPLKKEFSYKINEERILYWLEKGAEISKATKGIFKRSGLSYKWHLIDQGIKEEKIDALMEEWKINQGNREKLKIDKKKMKKTKASLSKEEVSEAAEEAAPEAEAAPAAAEVSETEDSDKKSNLKEDKNSKNKA